MSGGRFSSAVATLVSAVALAAPGSAGAAIWNPTGDSSGCIERAAIDDYEVVDRVSDIEVYGRGRSLPAAQRAADFIRGRAIWAKLVGQIGQPRREPAPAGGLLPYRLFITTEPLTDSDGSENAGLVENYCGETAYDAAAVDASLEGRDLGATTAHELFHSVSNGVADKVVGGWWGEATATWAQQQLVPTRLDYLDRAFIQRPREPIDLATDDPDFVDRPYGAWRFTQWFEGYFGGAAGLWDFIQATVVRMGDVDNTTAVTGELAGRGRSFGEDLGHFWGDRLRPTNPLNGPATEGSEIRFPLDDPVPGDPTVRTQLLEAVELGADVIRLKLERESHVQQITISGEPTTPQTYLWVQNGRELEDWTSGGSQHFCVGGASPSTGAKAWPGQFPVAFTNGKPVGSTLTHALTITVSAEECEGLVPDPSAAIDDSPVLELPDRCPDPPAEFSPPAGRTEYFVYRERLSTVFLSASTWQQAALARIERRDLGRGAAGRLFARWWYCTAKRVREIREFPHNMEGERDEFIPGWHGQFAAALRRVARTYDRGHLVAVTEILAAGTIYGRIIVRAQAEDFANAP